MYFSVLYRLCICSGTYAASKRLYLRQVRERRLFQLLFVCILNVIIVLLGSGLFRKINIKCIFNLITLCTYVMIASSAYRMGLYVSEYGLTATRLCVFWALGVIALFMLGVILSICRPAFSLFRYGIIVIGYVILCLHLQGLIIWLQGTIQYVWRIQTTNI